MSDVPIEETAAEEPQPAPAEEPTLDDAVADGEVVAEGTFRVRGAGGIEWTLDIPPPGSHAEDRYRSQIAKGELVVLGDNPFEPVTGPGPVTGSEQVEGGAPVPPVVAGTTQVGEASQPDAAVVPPENAEALSQHVADQIDATGATMTSGQPDATTPAEPVDPDAVPDGTVDEVLAWVGDDAGRAQRALDFEQAKGDQAARSTLLAKLEALTPS